MSSPRKDYGSAAIIPRNNKAMRHIVANNSPFSIHAIAGNHIKSNSNTAIVPGRVITDLENELTLMDRFLCGNREERVKAISRPVDVITLIKTCYKHPVSGDEIVTNHPIAYFDDVANGTFIVGRNI